MSRPRACMMIAAAALVLSACSTTLQVYSSPEHETLRLRQGDLRDGGLAFLTPSTVTGQEEDKQSLAHVFAATLQSERPQLRFVSLSETISAVNRAGLAEAYRTMYQNYRDTGVFDGTLMRRVAQAAEELYSEAYEKGHGDEDFAAVITAVQAQLQSART